VAAPGLRTPPPLEDLEDVEDLEPEEPGWAPVWVEDAAAGASIDDPIVPEAEAGAEETLGAAQPAVVEGCGCGGRRDETEEPPRDLPGEDEGGSEDGDDLADSMAPSQATDEHITIPFTWEDVREAVQAFDENDA
jgi:hypothetical protein